MFEVSCYKQTHHQHKAPLDTDDMNVGSLQARRRHNAHQPGPGGLGFTSYRFKTRNSLNMNECVPFS